VLVATAIAKSKTTSQHSLQEHYD